MPKNNSNNSIKPQQLNDNPYKPNMDEYNAKLNPNQRISPTKHKK